MGLAFFPFYSRAWIADTRTLTLEERGAYADLLAHMWNAKGGVCGLPDDDRVLSLMLGVRIDVWRRIRVGLATALVFDGREVYSERLRAEWEKAYGKHERAKSRRKVESKGDISATYIADTSDFLRSETRLSADLDGEKGSENQKQNQNQKKITASAVVADATPAASDQPTLISSEAKWPPDLDPVREHLNKLNAPGELFDPAFWRTIDATYGEHPTVAYLTETGKYLAHEAGKSGRRKHKNLKSGLTNWLRTAERIADDAAQKRAQWTNRPNEYPGANRR